jgi:2,4-dienoyl-CoA reductase-like NADH-dependent reductase (Old Yellow Enzyme family)
MKSLFDKTELAGMRLKNRFIRSATFERLAGKKGHMTKELYEIYEDLAKGGVGTIITGLTFVSDLENVYPGQTGIYDDTFIDEYQNLTGMVHRYNANIIMQLACNGSQTPVDPDSGKVVWGQARWKTWVLKKRRGK